MTQIAPGVYSMDQSTGGHVHAFLLDDGNDLTLIDTHGHRYHLGGLATLKGLSGATVYSHAWEADIRRRRARRPAHLAGPDAPLAHILARLLPPVRGRAGTRQTPAVPRGRHGRKRGYGRTRQGAPYSGLHSGPPRLLVARAKSPYSRRRHSHLPTLRAGMACIHPQPDAASGLPETHGRGFVVSWGCCILVRTGTR
jgi:hypothetical protein